MFQQRIHIPMSPFCHLPICLRPLLTRQVITCPLAFFCTPTWPPHVPAHQISPSCQYANLQPGKRPHECRLIRSHLPLCPPAYVCLCAHLSLCPLAYVSTCNLPTYSRATVPLPNCLCAHLSIYQPAFLRAPCHLSICPPAYMRPYVYVSTYNLPTCSPATCPFAHLPMCPYVYVSTCNLPTFPCNCLFAHLPTHPHLHTSPPVNLPTF
jgi:hypothetical protein